MKKVIIINALGFGKEVASWLNEMNGYGTDFVFKGYLDNRIFENSVPFLLGNLDAYDFQTDDVFVVALSEPSLKASFVAAIKARGGSFFSVVHPQNVISKTAIFGEGCILAPLNSISESVTIGSFATIYGFCKIGHDAQIGDFSHLASHCSVDGSSVVLPKSFVPSFTKIEKNALYGIA